MTIKLTEQQHRRLTEFYKDWTLAQERFQMALTTLQGAQGDEFSKKTRFEGALEMLAGPKAKWTYSPDDGVVVTEAPELGAPANGGPPTPAQIVAKATRRQLKRDLAK